MSVVTLRVLNHCTGMFMKILLQAFFTKTNNSTVKKNTSRCVGRPL